MTREERNYKLKKYITCLKCEVSGKCCDDNCPTQYEAGNMGEIIENLEAISKILEQEPKAEWIDGLIVKVLEEVDGGTDDRYIRYVDICERVEKSIREYCGAKMEG